MKKLSIVCALVMVFCVSIVQAAQYEAAPAGTKDFTTAASVIPNGTISLDIYLTGAGAPQNAGGAWIDFTGSTDDIAYVSGGRCMQDGSEGCTGPWTSGAGAFVNEAGGPGTVMYTIANLGGAAPDGDGDLIIGTVTLQNTGPNDATVYITTIPSVCCWTPLDPMDVYSGAIVISQVCDCTIDEDCDDGNFCNGAETCDAPNCTCLPGTDPCPADTTCNEDTDTCDPILTEASIPTLSEWGMIIFMTVIMGIGIMVLLGRKTL